MPHHECICPWPVTPAEVKLSSSWQPLHGSQAFFHKTGTGNAQPRPGLQHTACRQVVQHNCLRGCFWLTVNELNVMLASDVLVLAEIVRLSSLAWE